MTAQQDRAGAQEVRVRYLIRETDGDTRVASIENAREVDRLNAVIRELVARLDRLEGDWVAS